MSNAPLSEQETRVLIDSQLRAAGWEADTVALRYGKGARPRKGMNQAIAEWPTASGPADYAMFAGLQLLGFVEAKKKSRDVVSDLGQARRYAQDETALGSSLAILQSLYAGRGNPFFIPGNWGRGVMGAARC